MKKIIFFLFVFIFPALSFTESPYEFTLEKELLISGSGIMIAGAGFLWDRQNQDKLNPNQFNNLSPHDVNDFDRISTHYYSGKYAQISDISLDVMFILPASFLLGEETRQDSLKILLMYTQVLSFNFGTNLIAKNAFKRKRPYAYEENVPMEDKIQADTQKSFYSGHTSMAFASAVFVSTVYSDYYPDSEYTPWVWAATITAATGIGILRIRAGKHYPSDVLAGAFMGSLFGYGIPALHRKDSKIMLYPLVNDRERLLNVCFAF